MVTLAEIFRQYGPAYRQKHADRLLPSHRAAMQAIEQCRTPALGGQVYRCSACGQVAYQYHSCRNRHCPQCQNKVAEAWLARQQQWLLPVPYFLVTFTLPEGLRHLARQHQKLCYTLLFRTAAAALQQLAQDPRFVGGQIGLISVLHTWTRTLHYHPHVHCLVPGGGWVPEQSAWQPSRPAFLVPVQALSRLFRAKFRDALRPTEWFTQVPPAVWQQDWVVHSLAVGDGRAALKYLAPYIFRVAISNRRLVRAENGQVTFRYTDRHSGAPRVCTLPAEAFIQRFLQHVLPKGFVKVRYYGFFSSGNRPRLRRIRGWLGAAALPAQEQVDAPPQPCPACGGALQWLQHLPRPRNRSP